MEVLNLTFPMKKKGPYKDVGTRLGLSVYPFKGLSINTHIFYDKNLKFKFPGISIGYGM